MKITLAGLIFTLAVPTIALADDKIALKPGLEQGVAWSFDQSQDSAVENKATIQGQKRDINTKSHSHRAGKAVVVAAREGIPTSLNLTFDEDCDSTVETAGQQTQKVHYAYAGKTVTITRADDGSVTDDFTGQADPASVADLHSMMEQEGAIFPKHPVAVGDEWPADPGLLAKLVSLQGPDDTAGMTLKLLSVKDVGGRPTAELKVSMAVIRVDHGISIKLIDQGTALIDIHTGHAIRMDAKGTITTSGDSDQMPAHVEGGGTMTSKMQADLILNNAAVPAALPEGNPLAPAAMPATFAGKFSDGALTLELTESNASYTGSITLKGQKYPATAAVKAGTLEGSFKAGDAPFPFTASLEAQTLTLNSGGHTYTLKRAVDNPLGAPNPGNPLGN